MIQLLIGFLIVLLGFPLGSLLAGLTKEELKSGRIYFKILIIIAGLTAIAGLAFYNDALFFTSLFIMALTSKSLK